MEIKRTGMKILAVLGTLLVGVDILAPVFFTIMRLVSGGNFRFDYLMPAELGIVLLAGIILLGWAAFASKRRRGWIGWSIVAALVLVVGGQVMAVVTGLASGANQSPGLMKILLGVIGLFDLAVLVLFIGGLVLVGEMFKKTQPPSPLP